MLFIKVVVLLTCLAAMSCSRYQHVTKLSEQELVGHWVVTEDGRKFLEEFCCKDKPTELILSQDRTFRLVNIPDCWLVETRDCKATLSTRGSWKILRHDPDEPNSYFDLDLIDGNAHYLVSIGKNRNGLAIFFVFGDPDSGNSISVRKQ